MSPRDAEYRDPETPAEWQEAIDTAHALMLLEAARAWGLVTGGPTVNTDRCQRLIDYGAMLGYRPRPDAAERFVRNYNSGQPVIS